MRRSGFFILIISIGLSLACEGLLEPDSGDHPHLDIDKNLYLGLDHGELRKVNISEGQVWNETLSDNEIRSVELTLEGDIIAGDIEGNLFKVTSNGELLWSYSEDLEHITNITTDAENNIYALSEEELHKINAMGEHQWTYEDIDEASYGLEIDEEGRIIVSTGSGVHQLRSSNGSRLWSFDEPESPVYDMVTGDDQTIYVATYGDGIYLLDESGNQQSTIHSGHYIRAIAIDGDRLYISNELEAESDDGDDRTELIAFDLDRNTTEWEEVVDAQTKNISLDSDGRIYMAMPGEDLYVLDRDGNTVWEYALDVNSYEVVPEPR